MEGLNEAIADLRSLADATEARHPGESLWRDTASIARECGEVLADVGQEAHGYLSVHLGQPLQVLREAGAADPADPATARRVLSRYRELGVGLWSALEENAREIRSAQQQLAYVAEPGRARPVSSAVQSRWRETEDHLITSMAAVFEAVTVILARHDPRRFDRLGRRIRSGRTTADRLIERIAEAFGVLPEVPPEYDDDTRRTLGAAAVGDWWVPRTTARAAPFVRYLVVPPLTLFPMGVVLLWSQLRAWRAAADLVREVARAIE